MRQQPDGAEQPPAQGFPLVHWVPHFLARFRSPATRRTYLQILEEFFNFFERPPHDLHPSEVTEDHVIAYRRWLDDQHAQKGLAKSRRQETTIAKKMSALRSFFAFLCRKEALSQDPSAAVPSPRVRRQSRTRALNPQECGLIVRALEDSLAQTTPGTRTHNSLSLAQAVILTLFTTGLRVSELCALRCEDFEPGGTLNSNKGDTAHARLWVGRKGGRTQSLLLHPLTDDTLQTYLRQFRQPSEPGEPLFVRSQRGNKTQALTPKAVWLMVQKAGLAAGLTHLPSPHTLRATLATELHRQGVLLHRIQDLLGHSSPNTTTLYVKKLRDAADAPQLRLTPKSHSPSR